MVRVNLINVRNLADQHLMAEYLEIIMLVEYIRKHPIVKEMPKTYRLGKGHIIFFKNKVKYLKERHEKLAKEMKRRGFKPTKKLNLKGIPRKLFNNWKASKKDKKIIKKRLLARIRMKPSWYRYCGEKKNKEFWTKLIKNSN